MKKRNSKKILLAITALTFTLGLTCLGVACKSGNDGNNSSFSSEVLERDVVLELNKTQMNLVLGSSEKLETTYKNGGNEVVVYKSLDENIVTVNRGGVVTAVNTGQTTVQASYAGKTATCTVTVGLGEFVPVLQMSAIENNEITISMADKVNLAGVVSFNGETYKDATLTYALTDTAMGTISDGKFTPTKTGDVTITVSASWRGVTQETTPSLSVGVTVHVIDSVQFFVNENMVESVTLYSINSWGGQTFQNTMPFVAEAFINGEAVQTSVSVIGDDELVTWEGDVLTANKVGVGQLKLSCSDGEKEFFIQMPVNVIRPLVEYSHTITNFSFVEDAFDVEEIFGENVVLTDAYQNGNALQIEENRVLNLQSSNIDKTVTQVTLYTAQGGYTLNVEGYTRVVDTAEEMTALVTGKDTTITGYNFLNADLTLPELGNEYNDRYFKNGVFDGNGHTLTVVCSELYKFGLFGNMENATVKNLCIDMTKDFTGKLNIDAVLGYQTVGSVNFENVSLYLRRMSSDDTSSWKNSLVLFYEKTLLNNFVVTLDDGVIVTDTAGAEMLVYADGVNPSSKNVYLISPQTITFAGGTCYSSISTIPETESFSSLTQSGFWVYDKTNGALLWKPAIPKMVSVLLNNQIKTQVEVNAQSTVTVTGTYLDGTITPVLSVLEGEEFITVDENIITTLNKIGKVKIKATYIASGEIIEKIITIVVSYPVYQNGIIRLSDTTQEAYLPDGFTFVKVTDTDGVVYYENGNWDWSKITAPQTAEFTQKTLYVQTSETLWAVKTEIYAGIIANEEDFKYLVATTSPYTDTLTETNNSFASVYDENVRKSRKGYWILNNDVNINGANFSSMWNPRYFEDGVLDGNGYTLNVTMGGWSFGLFGNLSKVTIKNMKLNITETAGFYDNSDYNKNAVLYNTALGVSVFENVCIQINGSVNAPVETLYLTRKDQSSAIYRNVVIYIADGIMAENGTVFGFRNSVSVDGVEIQTHNCFVLANVALTNNGWSLSYTSVETLANAEYNWRGTLSELTQSGWWTYNETNKTLIFGKTNV